MLRLRRRFRQTIRQSLDLHMYAVLSRCLATASDQPEGLVDLSNIGLTVNISDIRRSNLSAVAVDVG